MKKQQNIIKKKDNHKGKHDGPLIGGQALIEGVMMKGPKYIACAVRTPEGKIKIKTERFVSYSEKCKILKWPVIRGVSNLIEMMVVGMKTLIYSANEQLSDEEEKEELSTTHIIITLILAFGLAFVIFKMIPLGIAKLVSDGESRLAFNAIDGIVRITMFILYLYLISRLKDVQKIFQYHGAEHKTVHCHEAGLPLTVKNVQTFKTAHPRCGTSFLALTLILSILIFSLVPVKMNYFLLLFYRIPLIFVIAGLSYELLRIFGRFKNNKLLSFFNLPGIWIQKITTRQPTNKQVEVAIESLKSVLKKEGISYK